MTLIRSSVPFCGEFKNIIGFLYHYNIAQKRHVYNIIMLMLTLEDRHISTRCNIISNTSIMSLGAYGIVLIIDQ